MSTSTSRPRRTSPGRPSTPILSVENIIDASLELIDERGMESFTMAAVAARLHVKAPSLYNHIPSKQALIEGIRDRIVSEMNTDVFDELPWNEALLVYARSYRAAFNRHPNTLATLAATPMQAPKTYLMYEKIALALTQAGWPKKDVHSIIASLEYLILGSVFDTVTPGLMWDPEQARRNGAPFFASCLIATQDQWSVADEVFERSLERFVHGLTEDLVHLLNATSITV